MASILGRENSVNQGPVPSARATTAAFGKWQALDALDGDTGSGWLEAVRGGWHHVVKGHGREVKLIHWWGDVNGF